MLEAEENLNSYKPPGCLYSQLALSRGVIFNQSAGFGIGEKWFVGVVLVEARAGAQVGVVSLSLVSGTIYRASFLNKSPSLRVG